MQSWLQQIEQHANENALKLLIGTKCDLEDKRQVSEEQAQAFAKEHGLEMMYTSAESGVNVQEAFTRIATMAVNEQKAYQGKVQAANSTMTLGQAKKKKKGNCCKQ